MTPDEATNEGLKDLSRVMTGDATVLIDLTKDEDALRAAMDQGWRNRLSKAERSDLLVQKAGVKPAVFVGVQGFMVSAFSKKQLLAKTFVVDYMGTKDAQLELFKAGGRPPALTAAFNDPTVRNDKDVRGFGLAAANGQPLPAIPAMGSVWGAWTDAYKLIFTKQGTPEQAFKDAATKIRGLIAAKG